MKIHQSHWNSFKRALYQFTMPVVSLDARGHQVRMESHPSLLSQIDPSILPELDSPRTEPDTISPPHNGLPGTRCKNIGVVPRPPYPSPLQAPRRPRQTKQKRRLPEHQVPYGKGHIRTPAAKAESVESSKKLNTSID